MCHSCAMCKCQTEDHGPQVGHNINMQCLHIEKKNTFYIFLYKYCNNHLALTLGFVVIKNNLCKFKIIYSERFGAGFYLRLKEVQ